MNWKQPTPTDINNVKELSFLERSLFREILSLCQNKNTLLQFTHADKHYTVELKRGQCILKVADIATSLKIGRKRIRKSLDILSKWYTEMHIKAMPFGLVITIKNYDEIVKMDTERNNEGTMKEQSRNNEGTANKNVYRMYKSDKNERDMQKKSLSQRGLLKKSLTEEEIWKAFVKSGAHINDVVRKYYEILDLIESGEFERRYPKHRDLYLTLINWVKLDIKRGYIPPISEPEAMRKKSYHPKNHPDFWARWRKAREEGRV